MESRKLRILAVGDTLREAAGSRCQVSGECCVVRPRLQIDCCNLNFGFCCGE